MREARYALNAAYNLACWCAVVVVATALASSLSPPRVDHDGASDPPPELKQSVVSDFECETTEVGMHVAEGRLFSHYSLRDDEGKELLRVMYGRSGRVVVTWGESFPVKAACSAMPGGHYSMDVVSGESCYRLLVRPHAASGFTVSGGPDGVRDGLGVTPEGKLVHGPTVLD
ncbi:MAG: hypothetical protein P4L85_15870 [Paludisphaera borealis]|uniref:hypothetical protein n=1 Tax=Paludisphaera borealis TaxID=1387353 RepID=UPI0028475260|nr:hypothetical protein [Paludisphaera borealis]MDR3620829.1 hypothetical protein [Paludisphaera borealis]